MQTSDGMEVPDVSPRTRRAGIARPRPGTAAQRRRTLAAVLLALGALWDPNDAFSQDKGAKATRQSATATTAQTTLDTIRVTAPRVPTERERFRAQLRRNWHPPRSAEQFGLDGGVPAWLGQQLLRGMTKAARATPGWKQQIQGAIARPPPLDEDQLQRALEQTPADAPSVP